MIGNAMRCCLTGVFVWLAMSILCEAQRPITVYLAGDSTMAEKLATKRPETGWGEFLQTAFDANQIKVENHAKNGRSTRTFISEGFWQGILEKLKTGDYVFIQFGHNDSSKEKVDRYTPPEDYKANLERMVADVRAKQAYPVLLTPLMRRKFAESGELVDSHGSYPNIVRSIAAELKVPLLDMHAASEKALRKYGAEPSRKLFLQLKAGEHPNYPNGIEDNTHFSPPGAQLICDMAVEEVRKLGLPIAKYLVDAAQPKTLSQ